MQLKGLKEHGISIIFISHKLDEVKALCDSVTVLRGGRNAGNASIENLDISEITRMMIGKTIPGTLQKEETKPADMVLSVRGSRGRNIRDCRCRGQRAARNR